MARSSLSLAPSTVCAPTLRELTVLAATDPANPYGAALPWPEVEEARLARDAGAYVFLWEGRLLGYLDRGRRHLTVLAEDMSIYGNLGARLSEIAARHRRTTVNTVNGRPLRRRR